MPTTSNTITAATHRRIDMLLALPRSTKKILAVLADSALCVLTVWIAICFRFEAWVSLSGYQWLAVALSILLAIPLLTAFGFYHTVVRFIGRQTLTAALRAIGVYTLIYSAIFTAFGLPSVPRTIGLIQPVLLLAAIGATRLLAQHIFLDDYASQKNPDNSLFALVYGTGLPAQQLALSLELSADIKVIGFVDEDSQLIGGRIQGLNVYDSSSLASICEKFQVRQILLAKSDLTRSQRNDVLQRLSPLNVAIRTLPSFDQWASPKDLQADQLRELDIEDLLGRDPVPPDPELLARNIKHQCVFITGAGGSIGSEIARQALKLGASKLVLFEISEFALYTIHEELLKIKAQHELNTPLFPILGNCCDISDLHRSYKTHQPTTVFHAAAYKHVPMIEFNVQAGIRNNLLGTQQTALLAAEYDVRHFTLISTDKAVRPTNVMGATKRIAELCIHYAQQKALGEGCKIRYSIVRFGNVLGSSGSVVPKFRAQIAAGGPITLTHPDITRFFMTIPEAAQLVVQAAAMSTEPNKSSPDTYLLDMGESVRIQDLARSMIRLSGRQVKDSNKSSAGIDIIYTGLRPGEKLFEELLLSGKPKKTSHGKIFQDTSELSDHLVNELVIHFDHLTSLAIRAESSAELICSLKDIVPEFIPDSRVS